MMVSPREPYDMHWPVRRGSLNVHSGVGGSMSAILQDLEDIWSTVLHIYLNIPRTDIKVCLNIIPRQTKVVVYRAVMDSESDRIQYFFRNL